ncbi:hypothetical protein B296_00014592 [Ensete ventricosum]|uniref:Uncharacterized protein n=1 Tax=Ensete ventricosum TaxID=4639 RepID=A0A426ZTW2_ENSVE|nr:hypothetical protein B296_00014592 [Ensete ventricosum]
MPLPSREHNSRRELCPNHDGRKAVAEDMTRIKLAKLLCVIRLEQLSKHTFIKRKWITYVDRGSRWYITKESRYHKQNFTSKNKMTTLELLLGCGSESSKGCSSAIGTSASSGRDLNGSSSISRGVRPKAELAPTDSQIPRRPIPSGRDPSRTRATSYSPQSPILVDLPEGHPWPESTVEAHSPSVGPEP